MTIKTLYNAKDEVWTMHENKPTRCKIERIRIQIDGTFNETREIIEYELGVLKDGGYCDTIKISGVCSSPRTFVAHQLFKSKQALLKTL